MPAILEQDGLKQRAEGARRAIAELQTVGGVSDLEALKKSLFELRQTLPAEQAEGVALVVSLLALLIEDEDEDEDGGSGSAGAIAGIKEHPAGLNVLKADYMLKGSELPGDGLTKTGGVYLPRPFPPCGAFASRRKITKDDIDDDDFWSEKNRQRRAQDEAKAKQQAQSAARLAALLDAERDTDEERPDEPSAAPR